jgi:hypothetical protein
MAQSGLFLHDQAADSRPAAPSWERVEVMGADDADCGADRPVAIAAILHRSHAHVRMRLRNMVVIDLPVSLAYVVSVEGAQHNIWVEGRKAFKGIRCESGAAPQR